MAAKKRSPKKKAATKKTKKKAITKKSDHLIARSLSEILDEMEKQDTGKTGAKPLYSPTFCVVAKKLAAMGAVDWQIADFFGVGKQTIQMWKLRYPEFKQALEVSKKQANENVKRTLYQRCMGYDHPEVKMFQHEGKIIKEETLKHYPPDVSAMKYWLNNREPDEWADKQEITGKDGESLIPHVIEVIYE